MSRVGAGERLHRVPPEALLEMVAGHGDGALALGERDWVGTQSGGGEKL